MNLNLKNIQKIDKLHPYPAKYTFDLISNFVTKYTKEGDIVIDPFMGSGTTGLVATSYNRKFIGADINPIAYLVSNCKLITLDSNEIKNIEDFKYELEYFLNEKTILSNKIVPENKYEFLNISMKSYKGIEHWFKSEVIHTLSGILTFIDYFLQDNDKLKTIALTSISSIIVTVSNQESNTRYVAIEKPNLNPENILKQYFKKLDSLFEMILIDSRKVEILNESKASLKNSKKFHELLNEEKADFLITSPPYPNTYDYYLYHKHRMLWLGYDFEPVMNAEIGSRREFSSLKKPPQKFNDDLFEIFESCNKVLKENAHIMIIIGDGKIRGEFFDSLKATIEIGKSLNWELIDADFTLLDETSKSFLQSFRTKGKKEHFILFKKK